MQSDISQEAIITKFKRNGHFLNRNSFSLLNNFLRSVSHPERKLDEIIKKINQMIIINQQSFNENTLQLAIQLVSHRSSRGQSFRNYEELISNLQHWTIFYLSPYQADTDKFFIDRPSPEYFEFRADDFLQMNQNRFKEIKEHNNQYISQNNMFIGMLYVQCSIRDQRNKMMLQNELTEIQIILPPDLQINCFLISGCTYIVKGEIRTQDFQLIVSEISLPHPLPTPKQTLCSQKFHLLCQNIIHFKKNIEFEPEDFKSYEVIYNQKQDKFKPVLIFGNFLINRIEIGRIQAIVSKFPSIQCIIFFLSSSQNEKVDMQKEFPGTPVFLVPHLNSEGPRILPKIPILRYDFNAKVLSNPARLSIHGQQCVFMNYPLIQNIHSHNLKSKQIDIVDSKEMTKKVSQLLFSQNNVGLCNKIFWKQSEYLNISKDNLLFICDKACSLGSHEMGKGGLASIGNFQRDGDFIALFPELESRIQICEQR